MRRLFLGLLMLSASSLPSWGQTISSAEFFIDTDPGLGLAEPFEVSPGDSSAVWSALNLGDLPPGPHDVCVRFRDDDGSWGSSYCESIFVSRPFDNGEHAVLSLAEFYVDEDPGVGQGEPFGSVEGDFSEVWSALNLGDLSPGSHDVCVRFRDDYGRWGSSYCEPIFVSRPFDNGEHAALSLAEFYVDEDPGVGQGEPYGSVEGDFSEVWSALNLGDLPLGPHDVCVRFRDDYGRWGSTSCEKIYFRPAFANGQHAQLVAGEFFFGSLDPGLGQGTSIVLPLTADSLNLEQFIPTDALTPGAHALTHRFRDDLGRWGANFTQEIFICGSSPAPTPIPLEFSGCEGDTISFGVEAIDGLTYVWTLPDGSTQNQTEWEESTPQNGTYVLQSFDENGCPSETANVQVSITNCAAGGCPEDIDDDGLVAINDLLLLLAAFGCSDDPCPVDVDGDGSTAVGDLLQMLASFGDFCD